MKLLASNLSLSQDQESARLTADSASGVTTLTVDNISGFAINQILLIGNFGDSNAEIVKTHTATSPTGSTITLAAATQFDHYSDTIVTVIDFDQIEFYRSTTLAGTKILLATQAISADRKESYYRDITHNSGFAFVRFKNTILTAFSEYSTGVPYTGNNYATVEDIIKKGCRDATVDVGGQYSTEDMLLDDANDCQDAVTDFDWRFELVKDNTSLQSTAYQNIFDLSDLTYEMKYPASVQGVKEVKFGSTKLRYVDNDEMDDIYDGVHQTELSIQANIGDTSITLVDSNEFNTAGTVYANGHSITYTSNDKTTGVLSGISPAAITAIIPAGYELWQNITPGNPSKYTITVDNKILLNCPVDVVYAGYYVKIEYLKKLTRFTDFSSTTEVPFTDVMPLFISAKIEKRKRNIVLSNGADDIYGKLMREFEDALAIKFAVYKLPILEDARYYNFFDDKGMYNINEDRLC